MRKPKYVQEFKDRYGKVRCYLRRPGHKAVPLPGVPWTPEFMAAYEAAMKGEHYSKQVAEREATAGTMRALTLHYLASEPFKQLRPSTQQTYRRIVDSIAVEHGARRVADLDWRKVKELLDKKAKTPHAANRWRKLMHTLMVLAVQLGMRRDDPTSMVRNLKTPSEGFLTWMPEHIEQYRAHHAPGTKARLALELLACTMQRRSDVLRMGRQHVRDGVVTIKQQKTGTQVSVPILPELADELSRLPAGQMTFLLTEWGRPFSGGGFGNWFRDRCEEAGLPPGYTAHGLRKYGACRLAETGAHIPEIMAWGGWKSVKEVQLYTSQVNRAKLAMLAYDRLTGGTKLSNS
jgi:site-specific recombinase XerD